jgi:NAD(P)-dependent dehydrogenase (short-subunit alcohol dehydrogenase family)
MPGILGHAVAAAGKEAMVRVLAAELASRGVRVIGIRSHAIVDAPAAGSFTSEVFTRLAAENNQDLATFLAEGPAQTTLLKRLPTLDEVAETATFLASDHSGVMTGTIVDVTGGAVT